MPSWLDSSEWRPPPIRWMVVVLVAAAVLLSVSVDARSPHPAPLRRLTHPSSSHLQIIPRQPSPPSTAHATPLKPRYTSSLPPPPSTLRHSDSLVLTLDLPDLLPFPAKLLLRPSEHLFHPDAKVTYGAGGAGAGGGAQAVFGEKLREEDYRLYTGEVVHPAYLDRLVSLASAGARSPAAEAAAKVGRASVIVHNPGDLYGNNAVWEGSFTVYGTSYSVMTAEKYVRVRTEEDVDVERLGDMVVFKQEDMVRYSNETTAEPTGEKHVSSCSHDALPFNADLSNPIYRSPSNSIFSPLESLSSLWRRDDTAGGMTISSNFIDSINSTAGCPNTQQIVYMGVALDCNYVAAYGSADAARTQVLNDWNQVSALYKATFNISLGIIELQVQNASCPSTTVSGEEWNVGCSTNMTLDERLSLFSAWRGTKGDDGAGLWHLMSACPTDSEVGVAWLGTLCQTTSSEQSGSTVSGTGISTATKTEWSLVAHEIGHGFGAIHDCTTGCSLSGSCCPFSRSSCNAGAKFIMNPTTSSAEESFSGCTLGNICSNIGNRAVTTTCIQSPGERTVISLQQCGNGIVEAGEDCDPGGNATSTCCDASTCKFRDSAVCDPSNDACCTSTCQFASSGTVCRAAVNSICDVAEVCSGTNATCPDDVTAADGTSCGSNGLACASGACTSLNLQCSTAGSSLGLSTACGQKDDTSCVVSCKDPNATNQCVVLQTPLVDGSPCGYGGHCYNSTCEASSWQATAAAWYKQNLQISIPVTIIVGLIVLAILFGILRCLFRCCGAKSRKNPQTGQMYRAPPQAGPGMVTGAGAGAGMAAGPQMSQLTPPPIARHHDSISSGDPLTRTTVISRDPSPAPQWSSGGGAGYDYGNGGNGAGVGAGAGYGQGYGYQQGYQPQQYQAQQGYPAQQGGGWVDDRQYNGPNYGRQEAYGR
ncbi:hypothetical protein IAT38_002230 [Cryptococcus sp. DSM 104549]